MPEQERLKLIGNSGSPYTRKMPALLPLWASIDGFYQGGGETTTDGISDDNSQRSINLGASVGLNLSRTWSVQFSYGQTVFDSRDGLDGEMYRLKFLTYF